MINFKRTPPQPMIMNTILSLWRVEAKDEFTNIAIKERDTISLYQAVKWLKENPNNVVSDWVLEKEIPIENLKTLDLSSFTKDV